MHAKRKTLMEKDSKFIRTIMGMWDPNCFLAQEPKRFKGRVYGGVQRTIPPTVRKGTARTTTNPHRTKQTAKNSTGGKAPRLGEALLARANRTLS